MISVSCVPQRTEPRRIVNLNDGLLKSWDVSLGRELMFFAVPQGIRLGHLALGASGNDLVAASADKLIVWRAPSAPR